MRLVTLAGLAVAGAAAAGLVASASGAPGSDARAAGGRIFFSSNRAANVTPQLVTIGRDGTGRRQLTPPLAALDQPALFPTARGSRSTRRQASRSSTPTERAQAADRERPRPAAGVVAGGVEDRVPDAGRLRGRSRERRGPATRIDSILLALVPAWSPDGSELAYAVMNAATRVEIRVAHADARVDPDDRVVPADERDPRVLDRMGPGKRGRLHDARRGVERGPGRRRAKAAGAFGPVDAVAGRTGQAGGSRCVSDGTAAPSHG